MWCSAVYEIIIQEVGISLELATKKAAAAVCEKVCINWKVRQ